MGCKQKGGRGRSEPNPGLFLRLVFDNTGTELSGTVGLSRLMQRMVCIYGVSEHDTLLITPYHDLYWL